MEIPVSNWAFSRQFDFWQLRCTKQDPVTEREVALNALVIILERVEVVSASGKEEQLGLTCVTYRLRTGNSLTISLTIVFALDDLSLSHPIPLSPESQHQHHRDTD